MSAKNIIALVVAVIVGFFLLRVLWWIVGGLLSVAAGLFSMLITGAIAAAVVYVLYKAFNKMLTSGKRLT